MSAQGSILVIQEVEAMLRKDAIQKGFPKQVVQVSLSIFRFWISSQDCEKTSGYSSRYSEANQHQNYYILRQHVVNEPGNGVSEDGKKDIELSLTTAGLLYCKSLLSPTQSLGFPVLEIDSHLSRSKSKEIDFKTSLIGTLCSTVQAVLPAFLQMR